MENLYRKEQVIDAFIVGKKGYEIIQFGEEFENKFIPVKTFTKEDLEKAYSQGYKNGNWLEFDEYYEDLINHQPIEEEKIPVTYGMIKNLCGWSKWCDVTGGNHYAINEFGDYPIETILFCTKEQFDKLF